MYDSRLTDYLDRSFLHNGYVMGRMRPIYLGPPGAVVHTLNTSFPRKEVFSPCV